MAKFRANQNVAVRHPEHGGFVTPSPAHTYDPSDPLVQAFPWLFSPEGEQVEEATLRESVPVEQATRAPGEKRGTRRAR